MKNLLIAFSGKGMSGKSTSSKLLKEIIEKQTLNQAEIFSFATEIKNIARNLFSWDNDKNVYFTDNPPINDKVIPSEEAIKINNMILKGHNGQISVNNPLFIQPEKEPQRDKGRQLLINIGQQMRWIRQSVWAEFTMKQINLKNAVKKENQIFIIDDLRFKSELNVIKNFKNLISIRLTRNSQLDLKDISEVDLDNEKFDEYIDNNKDMEDLKIKITEIYKKYIFGR